jgi:high-affinity iron transporter
MFSAAIIVFREVFEIAIIISIILAATQGIRSRWLWMNGGIAGGLMIVAIVAYFASVIVDLASQLGEHSFHALILLTATILIAWSVIWMQRHGREIASNAHNLSLSISNKTTPLHMLAIVIGLAVMREGSEIVLFLYGIYSAGQITYADIILGSLLGTIAGMLVGLIMYLGLIRIPVNSLFSVCSWLLTFLAAGMAAKAAGHLVKAGYLPALIDPVWDTSFILSQHSLLGRFLSVLIGYQDHPSAMSALFYTVVFVLITLLLMFQSKYKAQRQP